MTKKQGMLHCKNFSTCTGIQFKQNRDTHKTSWKPFCKMNTHLCYECWCYSYHVSSKCLIVFDSSGIACDIILFHKLDK